MEAPFSETQEQSIKNLLSGLIQTKDTATYRSMIAKWKAVAAGQDESRAEWAKACLKWAEELEAQL